MADLMKLPKKRIAGSLEAIESEVFSLELSTCENAYHLGSYLIEAKEEHLEHGEFIPWLEMKLKWRQQSTWQRYMDFTRRCDEAGMLLTLLGKNSNLRYLEPPPVPSGKYSCLVIDPPWPMQKIERDVRPKQHGFDYPTLTEEQIADESIVPIRGIAADNCHMYLWTTHKFIPMALRLAEGWGFGYQCLMTWVKNVGFSPFSWMYSTEHVLFCRRGNLDLLKNGIRLDFQAKVREHSRKPAEFYELVKMASPGPRLDMFSREVHDGFDSWGNEEAKFGSMAEG